MSEGFELRVERLSDARRTNVWRCWREPKLLEQWLAPQSSAALIAAFLISSAPAFAQDDTFGLEEVIVTAQKRDQRLADVPVAVSVFGGDAIDQTGVRELKDVADYIPNLQISEGNDFRSTVRIRGVGATSRNIGFDTRVGVYVDGVYVGQSPAINQELLDIERIEVLRGPQGALFGKNTVAGAVNLITKKPDDEFHGSAGTSFGNLGYREINGLLNVPLSEAVTTAFSVAKTDRDGYVRNIVTGSDLNERDVLAYRAQGRVTPNDRIEIYASIDGLNSEGLILIGDPVTNMLATQPVQSAPELGVVAFSFDPLDKRDIYGGHVDLSYRLADGHTLKSITGYRAVDATYTNATDYSPVDIVSTEYTDRYALLSQELQLSSPDANDLTYVLGLYLYRQDAKTHRDVVLGADLVDAFVGPLYASGALSPPLPAPPALPNGLVSQLIGLGPPLSKVFNHGEVETRSYAAYFTGAYRVTDRWKLGFGLRYSSEEKEVDWLLDGRNSGPFNIGSTGPDPQNPSPMVNDRADDFLAPAVSLTYALSEESNVYARYAAGYKSGGFNLDYVNAPELAANPTLEFDEETVDSYEVGLKGAYFDGRLALNAAAFIAEYEDYQVNSFADLGGGRTSIRISNAAKVETTGLEAETRLQVTPDFMLRASLGLLDAKFDAFPGGGTQGADVSGNDLPFAPEISYSLGATYYQDVPALQSTLLIRADVTHDGEVYTTADNVTEIPYNSAYPGTIVYGRLPGHTEVNARIGLMSGSETWEVYLWGHNLTDEVEPQEEVRDFFGTIVKQPGLPRSYGVELRWRFRS